MMKGGLNPNNTWSPTLLYLVTRHLRHQRARNHMTDRTHHEKRKTSVLHVVWLEASRSSRTPNVNGISKPYYHSHSRDVCTTRLNSADVLSTTRLTTTRMCRTACSWLLHSDSHIDYSVSGMSNAHIDFLSISVSLFMWHVSCRERKSTFFANRNKQ